jgi:hypothetical protein
LPCHCNLQGSNFKSCPRHQVSENGKKDFKC